MHTHPLQKSIGTPAHTRLAQPKVLRVVHSIRREQAAITFAQQRRNIPRELNNYGLSAYERDYLNWYHGDPLKVSFVQAHKQSINHRAELLASERCGCFHCGEEFAPRAITDWVQDSKDATAFCPHCDIDAVIGDASGYPITVEFLSAMRVRWFGMD